MAKRQPDKRPKAWLPHDVRRMERKLAAGHRPHSIANRLGRTYREFGRLRKLEAL